MPDPTTTQPEQLVATALARFAALSPELRDEFQRHVLTLNVLYPRHHNRWKETYRSGSGLRSGALIWRTVSRPFATAIVA